MLDSMLDGEEPQVLTTVDSTSPEDREVLTTVDSTSPFAGGERREREKSPLHPLKEKVQEKLPSARARGKLFTKPTVEEVAVHIKANGYTFDAEAFWNFYESNGWYVGRRKMKSWTCACVTWQKRNGNGPRPLTAYERKRAEFELEAQAIAARKEESRRAAIAALTDRDWALCAEHCRHCTGSGCSRDVALPPDHRLNPRPCRPEECPGFSAKDQLASAKATAWQPASALCATARQPASVLRATAWQAGGTA